VSSLHRNNPAIPGDTGGRKANPFRRCQNKAGDCKPGRNAQFSVVCRNDDIIPVVEALGYGGECSQTEDDRRRDLEDASRHEVRLTGRMAAGKLRPDGIRGEVVPGAGRLA